MMKKISIILTLGLLIIVQSSYGQASYDLHQKYEIYRDKLLSEWILISPNVEQFGVNIPAVDRRLDSTGTVEWVSWSDGNSNFNHWLGILSTEYRLLKDNGEDYSETFEMLIYSLLAIERLDLYSEYTLRHHHGLVDSTQADYLNIKYPDDINGFLIRDDVTLGFWRQYYKHFNNPEYGWHRSTKDGTNRYLSVFQKGVIPKQGMSQDNIIYMMQSLALIKILVDNEPVSNIRVNFINNYIPRYLIDKGIMRNDSVFIDKWVNDITNRLVNRMRHPYPEQPLVLKPYKGMARLQKNNLGGIMHSRWYLLNPITNDLVAEGNGEDMGVWINSYGIAEAANFITGGEYHLGQSDSRLNRYLFNSILFKNMRILKFGGFPIPESIDDYMLRTCASIADINWNTKSKNLLYLLGDKREGWTYEHNELILLILHKEKYSDIFKPGNKFYEKDKKYFEELLGLAPISGPSTDYSRPDYHPYWSASSRLNWPANEGNHNKVRVMEFAGMDYLFLYNLYRLVFEPNGYQLTDLRKNSIHDKDFEKYKKPYMDGIDAEFFYMPPKKK